MGDERQTTPHLCLCPPKDPSRSVREPGHNSQRGFRRPGERQACSSSAAAGASRQGEGRPGQHGLPRADPATRARGPTSLATPPGTSASPPTCRCSEGSAGRCDKVLRPLGVLASAVPQRRAHEQKGCFLHVSERRARTTIPIMPKNSPGASPEALKPCYLGLSG